MGVRFTMYRLFAKAHDADMLSWIFTTGEHVTVRARAGISPTLGKQLLSTTALTVVASVWRECSDSRREPLTRHQDMRMLAFSLVVETMVLLCHFPSFHWSIGSHLGISSAMRPSP